MRTSVGSQLGSSAWDLGPCIARWVGRVPYFWYLRLFVYRPVSSFFHNGTNERCLRSSTWQLNGTRTPNTDRQLVWRPGFSKELLLLLFTKLSTRSTNCVLSSFTRISPLQFLCVTQYALLGFLVRCFPNRNEAGPDELSYHYNHPTNA